MTSGRQFEQLSYVPLSSVAIEGELKGLGCATTRCAPSCSSPVCPTQLDKIKNLHLEVRPGILIIPRLHELLSPCMLGAGLATISSVKFFGEISRRTISSTFRTVSSVL